MNMHRTVVGAFGGVGLLLVAGLVMFGLAHPSAGAADLTGRLDRSSVSATPVAARDQALIDAAFARFAARLGVSEASMGAAFAGAVNDTMDQVVRDGTLTQVEADQVKATVAKNGLKGLVAASNPGGSGGDGQGGIAVRIEKFDAALVAAWNTASTALGYADPAQMKRDLASGKSLAALALARGVDVPKLREGCWRRPGRNWTRRYMMVC